MTDELRLLLVDDSEDDARLIERALRRDGLDVAVTRVETEADFRAALAQSRWDAILTDYHLPAFDGLVALRLALSLGRGCPVILVSGAVGEETAVAAMKAGANDYVLKSNLARLGPALRRELVEMTVREERNQAEQALRDSEARLRFVTDHMLDMISEVDALGIMQYASPSHEVILGHPLSALVGESVFQFVHDDDVSAVLEAFQEGFATRSPRTVVYRFRHAAGHYLWLESRGNPVVSASEDILGGIISSRDVTARKRAEAAIQFRLAFEQLIASLSTRFLNLPTDEIDAALNSALQEIGEFFRVDRSYIFQFEAGGAVMSNTHEWCAPGIPSARAELQNLSVAQLPYVVGLLRRGEVLHVPRLSALPTAAAAERAEFEREGIQSLICVPVASGGELAGFMGFDSVGAERQWTPDEIALLRIAGETFVTTLQRHRAEAAEREQRALAEALRDMAAAITSTLDLQTVLGRVLEYVGRVVAHDAATIMLLEGNQAYVAAHRGYAERGLGAQVISLRLDLATTRNLREMAARRQFHFIADMRAYGDWVALPTVAWVQSYAGAPICHREEVIGFINLDSATLGFFTAAQAARLQAFADQTAVAIANARLFESGQQRVRELERSNAFTSTLAQVGSRVQSTLNVEEVLEALGQGLKQLKLMTLVALGEPHTAVLKIRYVSLAPALLKTINELLGVSALGFTLTPANFHGLDRLLRERQARLEDDFLQNMSAAALAHLPRPIVLQAFRLAGLSLEDKAVLLPLTIGEEAVGLLEVWGPDLAETDLPALGVLASQVATALEKAQLFEAERRRVTELERSTAITTALAQVASRLQSTVDTQQVLEVMAAELLRLRWRFLIALRNAGEPALSVRFTSADPGLLSAAEKLTGLRLYGFRLTPDNFMHLERLTREQRPVLFLSAIHELADAVRVGLSPTLFGRALRLLIQETDRLAALPLNIGEHLVGVMEVWGPDLQTADLSALSIFASQVAAALEKAQLLEAERQRALELARSNALVTALAGVAAQLESTSDPEQILATLGKELRQLDLSCAVALREAGEGDLRLRYTNLDNALLKIAQRSLNLQLTDYRLTATSFPRLFTALATRKASFLPNAAEAAQPGVGVFSSRLVRWLFQQIGLASETPALELPLLAQENSLGILGIWGPALREADVAPFTVFASQLAAALEKARLLEAEQNRSAELARSNRLIAALADVASQVQGALDADRVLETLGAQLEALGVSCLVALQESDQSDLPVRYLSVGGGLQRLAEQQAGLLVSTYRVPRRAWPIVQTVVEHRPVYSRDIAGIAAAMLPGLPGPLIKRLVTTLGIASDWSALYLPMLVDERVLGLLAVWGKDLREADLPAYMVLASQVATALENAALVAHLENARRAAEKSNELKTEFLANVSHELRTPLTAILGSLDLVLSDVCDSPEEARQFTEMAQAAAQRQLAIVNDMLDLAKIEAGSLEVNVGVVEAAPLLRELAAHFQPTAAEKGLHLELREPSDALPAMLADLIRVRQILYHLMDNALKFTEQGTITLSAELSANADGLQIHVQDTGIGISPDMQAGLFQPFRQVDGSSTRKYGGAGLGLSIARRLAELMKGAITLSSAGVGRGSTFTLSLPVAATTMASWLDEQTREAPLLER